MNSTIPQFDKFVCIGDSVQWEKDGFTLTARIEHDADTKPEHSDCYTEEQTKAFDADEWMFVGIVITVHKGEVEINDHAASLWGIDCNFPGGNNTYLATVCEELQDEALEQAKADVVRILADLNK